MKDKQTTKTTKNLEVLCHVFQLCDYNPGFMIVSLARAHRFKHLKDSLHFQLHSALIMAINAIPEHHIFA